MAKKEGTSTLVGRLEEPGVQPLPEALTSRQISAIYSSAKSRQLEGRTKKQRSWKVRQGSALQPFFTSQITPLEGNDAGSTDGTGEVHKGERASEQDGDLAELDNK